MDAEKPPSWAGAGMPTANLEDLVVDNGINVGVVLLRLRTLEVNLEEEGAYTRSNTAWLAAEAIRALINIANRSK